VVSTALACVCAWFGRRRADREAFTVAVTLMLTAAPLVDNHYFALLLAPIAIKHSRLSGPLLLGLLFWLCPATGVTGWEVVLAWALAAAIAAWLMKPLCVESSASSATRSGAPGGPSSSGRAPRLSRE